MLWQKTVGCQPKRIGPVGILPWLGMKGLGSNVVEPRVDFCETKRNAGVVLLQT